MNWHFLFHSMLCRTFVNLNQPFKLMMLEGLKLMILGMATVMLFLLLLIACIELVRFLTRNFTLNQEQSLLLCRNSDSNKFKTTSNLELPVEVFAATISSYESDNNIS